MNANQQTELTQLARQRADARIDAALGDLRTAAREIGKRHGIPENISGLSVEDLLGRMTYVPSMARQLRAAAGQEIARLELEDMVQRSPYDDDAGGDSIAPPGPAPSSDPRRPDNPPPPPPGAGDHYADPSKIPAHVPAGMDVGDLSGVTVQTVKALRDNGLRTVGDVVTVPDEHLAKLRGLGEKSVGQLREAIARASQSKAGQGPPT